MHAPCLDVTIGVSGSVLSRHTFEPIRENDPLHAPCLDVTTGVKRRVISRSTCDPIRENDPMRAPCLAVTIGVRRRVISRDTFEPIGKNGFLRASRSGQNASQEDQSMYYVSTEKTSSIVSLSHPGNDGWPAREEVWEGLR